MLAGVSAIVLGILAAAGTAALKLDLIAETSVISAASRSSLVR